MGDESGVNGDAKRRELEILTRVLADLHDLDDEGRQRVLQTASTYYRLPSTVQPHQAPPTVQDSQPGPFSEDHSISPKNFIMQKEPRTDVERVACLAYYLTHYRDTPHFKTLDISKLNTDAAQPKFSNAAFAVDNAMKMGYLVPATRGNKQLSAAGEGFVLKLPDREAAKLAMASARPRRKSRRSRQSDNSIIDTGEGDNK